VARHATVASGRSWLGLGAVTHRKASSGAQWAVRVDWELSSTHNGPCGDVCHLGHYKNY